MSKLPTSRLPVTPSKTSTTTKSGLRPPQQTSTNAAQQVSPSGGDAASQNFSVGDRVMANGKSGTIAFVGPTKFADGEWIGVILDEAQGKNDGSYEGTRYFETEANRGLFCRAAKVTRLAQNGANSGDATAAAPSTEAQPTPAADTSKVSTTTPNNDKPNADTAVIAEPNPPSASTEQPAAPSSTSDELRVGDRVVVSGTKFGTLKYLGKIHVAEGIWCGIQLDDPLGKNDGSVSGKRYFTCQQRYGLFSPLARVEKVSNDMTQSQITARKASISSSTNAKSQLHRSTSQESLHSNLSEFSTSSNSVSRIPTRTPAKMQQQKLTTNSNMYTTPNTKSLLTQAAATLAAVTPSSNQLNTLIQTIKDKDITIQKLQNQSEQDRLEFSRAAQQVDEIENRMLVFKQQLDLKETENEQLKKEQYQTKQRIEDLEFQLEEYKLTDANKEHSNAPIIPDGHRLLTPKDIKIYEEIKQKVLELETTNQKLILEKQTLQDEHRQELKRQNELIDNNFQGRINELEQKLNDNSKNQENNQLIEQLQFQIAELRAKEEDQTEKEVSNQQIQLEQSRKEIEEIRLQLNVLQQEKDIKEKQANELTVQLKTYQENLLPELEKKYQTLQIELTDLRNQDRTTNLVLNERESQFEKQIKEYQTNLNETIQNTDKIRNELKQIQEENLSKEKQLNEIIKKLKQDHEQVQTEFQQQEQKSKSIITEYEQQIKDLQIKFEQTQSEVTKLQQEKISIEKQSNETINSLKQDYTKLKTELIELQDRDRTQNMALNEREVHYENQIKDYQNKRDQTLQEIQELRNELTKLCEEKTTNEQQLNQTINLLKENQEKIQTNFREQEEKTKSTISQYEQQIKDLQQTQSNLTKLQEEKMSLEKQLNETMNSFKQDREKLQTEFIEQDKQSKLTIADYEHQIKDLQTKFEQSSQQTQSEFTKLQQEKISIEKQLNNTIDSLKQNYESQLQSLQTKLTEFQTQQTTEVSEKDQQINDYRTKFDRITQENTQLQTQINDKSNQIETLKNDLQSLQNKLTNLQIQCQNQLSSNEQLKNTNDNIVNEKQAVIDQLTKQIQDMQQVQSELIEKQVKQHADFEKQIQILKNEYLVEIENLKLEHEQENLQLKQAAKQTDASGNVKKLEYDLVEARYKIEKLEKQLSGFGGQDQSTLESQINFLNEVIVELRNANEQLRKEVEFLKNPFVNDNEAFSTDIPTKTKSSAPRLYCDMCEVFDLHDTDDCPKQSSLVDDQPVVDHHTRERVLPPQRAYCEKCEEFGHDCNENDETY